MADKKKRPKAEIEENWPDLRDHLIRECDSMIIYAFANGKKVEARTAGNLEMIKRLDSFDPSGKDMALLAKVHNELQNIVSPALPSTISMFERNKHQKTFFSFLGPVPLVQKLIVLAVVCLTAMLGFSLSPDVNTQSVHDGLLDNSGMSLAVNLMFLISAAGVGATFAALYRANDFIVAGTYDPTYDATYWAQFVLGLVAGILLAELIPIPENAMNDDVLGRDFAKPILSLLGGFSARAVYSILNFLIEMIDNLLKKAGSQTAGGTQSQALMEAQMGEKLATQRAEMLASMNLVSQKVQSGATHEEIKTEIGSVFKGLDSEEHDLMEATKEVMKQVKESVNDSEEKKKS